MPLEAIAEALIQPIVELVLRPIAEGVMHAGGYLTWLLIGAAALQIYCSSGT